MPEQADGMPDHHHAAEVALDRAREAELGSNWERYEHAVAQVHALLALDQTLGRFLAKLEALDAE